MKVKKNSIVLIACICIALFPVAFLYLRNMEEVSFKDFYSIAIVYLAIEVAGFFLIGLFMRSLLWGGMLCFILTLLALNYAAIENLLCKFFSHAEYWHIIPTLLVMCIWSVIYLSRHLDEELVRGIFGIISLVFGGLILFNILFAIPSMLKIWNAHNIEVEEEKYVSPNGEIITELPNIYWMVFDEYSNFDVIDNYYGYDNSDFFEFLKKNDFSVSLTGKNDSYKTATVLTNYMNLEYVATDQTSPAEISALRENPAVFTITKEMGYQNIGLGSAGTLGVNSELLECTNDLKKEGMTMGGDSFTELLLKQTLYYPFISSKRDNVRGIVLDGLDNLVEISKNSEKVFALCYVMCPHEPFVFDAQGHEVDSSHYYDWKDTKYYLNQYIYCTSLMEKTIEKIKKNDPNCIIILQSDHSARAGSDKDLYLKWIAREDMKSFLNTVYMSGNNIEIEGMTGVNTLRTIFNTVFMYDFPMLEVN